LFQCNFVRCGLPTFRELTPSPSSGCAGGLVETKPGCAGGLVETKPGCAGGLVEAKPRCVGSLVETKPGVLVVW